MDKSLEGNVISFLKRLAAHDGVSASLSMSSTDYGTLQIYGTIVIESDSDKALEEDCTDER